MKKICLFFVSGLIILITFIGCTATTTIISEIQPQITTSQIGIGVIQPTTTSQEQTYNTTASLTTPIIPNTDIYITSPKNFDDWYVGESVTIEWLADDAIPANTMLTVYLDTGDGTHKYLIGSTPNTGSFNWVVTSQFVGMDVSPDIEYSEGGYSENLVPIEISSTPLPATTAVNGPISINITSPQSGSILHPGDTVNIKWTTINIPSYAFIGIGVSGGGKTYLTSTITNTGSFTWVVPSQISATQLQINLTTVVGGRGVTVSVSN